MEIYFAEPCYPPKSTAQGSNTILRTRAGRRFVGKKSTSKGKAAQNFWMSLMRDHKPPKPLQGPVTLDLIIHFPHAARSRKAVKEMIVPHTAKPDLDNLSKIILDCGTKVGFWTDDSQICDLRLRKSSAPNPGVIFRAWVEPT